MPPFDPIPSGTKHEHKCVIEMDNSLMTPVLSRCIDARQWQHVSAMTGLSEHAVRLAFDPGYGEPKRKAPLFSSPAKKPIPRRRKVGRNTSATAEWTAGVRARAKGLGWSMADLARAAGMEHQSLRTMMAPSGHMTAVNQALVISVLARAENT